MKKPGELDVAGQVEWGKLRKLRREERIFRFVLVAGCAFMAWLGWISVKPAHAPDPTFTLVSGSGVSYGVPANFPVDLSPIKPQIVTDVAILQGFHAAIQAWTAALGGRLPIRYPRLVKTEDAGYCAAPQALAYADVDTNRVVFCRLWGADPETLMLHEIGHLLGVPHIQDDDLMDAIQHGAKRRAPTPAAIALAKLAHPVKN